MRYRSSYFSFLFMMCFSTVNAQNTALDKYQELVDVFTTKAVIAFQADVKVYDTSNTDASPIEHSRMDYRKSQEQLYVKYDQIEMFKTRDNYLHINNETKTIHQLELGASGSVFPGLDAPQLMGFVKLLSLEGTLYKTEDGFDGIRFAAPEKTNTSFEVVYDPNSNYIIQTTTILDFSSNQELEHPMDGKKIEIRFYDHKSSQIDFPIKLASINRHIRKNKERISSYDGYQVIK